MLVFLITGRSTVNASSIFFLCKNLCADPGTWTPGSRDADTLRKVGMMRGATAWLGMACALAACHLATPFSSTPTEAGPDADGDADGELPDGNARADADGRDDSDADGDRDVWQGHRCEDALPGVEEKWAVTTVEGGVLRGWITGRDCEDPQQVCERCFLTAISPDGRRAVAVYPEFGTYPYGDTLELVDLESPDFSSQRLPVDGVNPSWRDDEHLLVVTPSADHPDPCTGTPGEDHYVNRSDVVVITVESGDTSRLVRDMVRLWVPGFVIAPEGASWVASGADIADDCDGRDLAVLVYDTATHDGRVLDWTTHRPREHVFGQLPDGSGFLVHRADHDLDPGSSIYHVLWLPTEPVARRLYLDGPLWNVGREVDLFQLIGDRKWGQCTTVGRLGPACELYCHQEEGARLVRLTVTEAPPEDVECSLPGERLRLMDVWQR
jgi:hypothetical protein